MKQIIFSTGNKTKLNEAIKTCKLFDIEITQRHLDIDEIQSHNPLVIARHKAEQAYGIVKQPVVVNDSFWSIVALNGFPGGYMKDMTKWFNSDDFLNLMRDKSDRRFCITDCIVYQDDKIEKTIVKEFWGVIADSPVGNGNSIENVAIINGLTLAQYHELGRSALKTDENIWNEFAKWFSEYEKPV